MVLGVAALILVRGKGGIMNDKNGRFVAVCTPAQGRVVINSKRDNAPVTPGMREAAQRVAKAVVRGAPLPKK